MKKQHFRYIIYLLPFFLMGCKHNSTPKHAIPNFGISLYQPVQAVYEEFITYWENNGATLDSLEVDADKAYFRLLDLQDGSELTYYTAYLYNDTVYALYHTLCGSEEFIEDIVETSKNMDTLLVKEPYYKVCESYYPGGYVHVIIEDSCETIAYFDSLGLHRYHELNNNESNN